MRLHPCTCGQRIDVAALGHSTAIADAQHLISSFSGSCASCQRALSFEFLIADDAPKGRASFGGSAPSTIIDPGEFYLASDEFAKAGDLERAIACLEEILKFIPAGEENVPASCFHSAAGARLKLERPGRFVNYLIEARIAAYRENQAEMNL